MSSHLSYVSEGTFFAYRSRKINLLNCAHLMRKSAKWQAMMGFGASWVKWIFGEKLFDSSDLTSLKS
ncbi:hypothetical protein L596_008050 [Steinernema carpocapsae]|uniref:Uncharacterized protein n=1 Tax=Steinernema carpocapsae TaxID=34508 RepID=A0A4U5PBJ5_STECR|nr:hypothetical protein L596_008050 [Steinernema carpocapsae]